MKVVIDRRVAKFLESMRNQKKSYTVKELKAKLIKNSEFRREYEKLQPEYQIACQILEARLKQKVSQEELARRAGTGQAVISRLEGMNAKPSISLLERIATALNTRISITIQ